MKRRQKKQRNSIFYGLIFSVALMANLWVTHPATADNAATPRNIILIISDGMGYNHSLAASYFTSGHPHSQPYWQFPVQTAVSTFPHGGHYSPDTFWSNDDEHSHKITDSAAAATAMATGHKTLNKAIGVDPLGQPLPNIVERAESLGKSTGLVTSVTFSHATPAAFATHVTKRKKKKQIAKQLILNSGLDVLMGCGHPRYDDDGKILTSAHNYKQVGGQQLWKHILAGQAGGDADADGIADPWTLIQSRRQFLNLASSTTPKRVLGIPMIARTLQQERSGRENAAPFTVPFVQNVPTLSEMARAALNVVDNNSNGFFLMIESGAVDWAGHDTQMGRMIEEQIATDQTVAAVIDWIETNSSWKDTLLIFTADHETGFLTGPSDTELWSDVVNCGQGQLPAMQWRRIGHTNALVPLFAKGVGSEQFKAYYQPTADPVRGPYIDNTAIGLLILSLLFNQAP